MGTDKRARQKANRQAKLAAEQAETTKENREQSTRRIGTWVAIGAAIIGLIVLIGFVQSCGGDQDGPAFQPATDTTETEVDEPEIVLADEVPGDFAPFSGAGALALVEPAARNGAYDTAPEMAIDPTKEYGAVMVTDAGTIRFDLFADEAPITVNSFVNLARDGYFDGTTFHRVIAGFMAQGGDPSGSGSGGPGYSIVGEFDAGRVFDSRGQLAMANPNDPHNNGSQFFVTFSPQPGLNNLHTIFGQVLGDDAVLDSITITDSGAEPTIIESISIVEG